MTEAEPAGAGNLSRIRLDEGEFAAGVQDAAATGCRDAVAAGRRLTEAGAWFQSDVRRLDGFDADGAGYSVAVDL